MGKSKGVLLENSVLKTSAPSFGSSLGERQKHRLLSLDSVQSASTRPLAEVGKFRFYGHCYLHHPEV